MLKMPSIKVAKNSGFCFGVKKAIEIAEEVAEKNTGKSTYVLGQLVHNERVIDDLGKKGIVFVDNIQDIPQNAVTVLRAHGEPGTTYKILEEKSITKNSSLNDATCPLVTLVHNVAIKLKNNGYEVIIFGKHDHPESIGTSYHLKGKDTFIVEDAEDFDLVINYIKKNNYEKYAIISQTTMSVYGYKKLIEDIKENKIQFDVAIATPSVMAKIAVLGKELGPKGLMPNPKNGTVTDDIKSAVSEYKKGKQTFACDTSGVIHMKAGKLDMDDDKLIENIHTAVSAVEDVLGKVYNQAINRMHVVSTMGPSFKVTYVKPE